MVIIRILFLVLTIVILIGFVVYAVKRLEVKKEIETYKKEKDTEIKLKILELEKQYMDKDNA